MSIQSTMGLLSDYWQFRVRWICCIFLRILVFIITPSGVQTSCKMWSANDAKLISILVVSLCSYVTGLLPGILGLGSRCQKSTLLSSVLCFGGGVLLATSIVHILPETRESLNKWAEVVFCCGFFGIYCLDVLVHYLNYSPESEASEEVVNSEGIITVFLFIK